MEAQPNSISPPGSPEATSDDSKRLSKMKSWGRMISIRTSAAESVEDNWAGQSPSKLKSNEQEMAGLLVSNTSASVRIDPSAVNLQQTPSAEPANAGGATQLQNGAALNSARILVRHRSSRSSSLILDLDKSTAGAMHVSAKTSMDRHCSKIAHLIELSKSAKNNDGRVKEEG